MSETLCVTLFGFKPQQWTMVALNSAVSPLLKLDFVQTKPFHQHSNVQHTLFMPMVKQLSV